MTNIEFIQQFFSNQVFDYEAHSLPRYDEFLESTDPETGFRITEKYGVPYPCEGDGSNIVDVTYVDSQIIRMEDGREIKLEDVDTELLEMTANHFRAFEDWCNQNNK